MSLKIDVVCGLEFIDLANLATNEILLLGPYERESIGNT